MKQLTDIQIQNIFSDIKFSTNNQKFSISYKNKIIDSVLKNSIINNNVQFVANKSFIRKMVNQFLHSISKEQSIIVDGRDMSTVVFPDAEIKFFLNADVLTRAKRSLLEYKKNTTKDIESIQKAIIERDKLDKNRKWGGLHYDNNSIYIDNTDISLEETVNKMKDYVDNKLKQ